MEVVAAQAEGHKRLQDRVDRAAGGLPTPVVPTRMVLPADRAKAMLAAMRLQMWGYIRQAVEGEGRQVPDLPVL